MRKWRFGVIGCEHAHIEIFIQEMLALGHECVGIYEPNHTQLAKSFAEKYSAPLVDDQDKLLSEVEIVGSSAINNEKINIIEQCEKFGKHIMLDKPAATNRRDFERLQALISRGRIEVGMLLTERFHPANYTLKQQIDRGLLGELVSIGTRKPHRLNPSVRPQWFFSKEQCGGIIIDLLIHDYDLLRWFTGKEIVKSEGYMAKRILPEYPGFYDTASVQVLMEGNLIAQLYADWYTPVKSWTWGDGRIFVTGTEGFAELRLTGDPFVKNEELVLCTTNSEAPTQVVLEHPSESITGDFLRRIESKPSLLTSKDILLATEAAIQADEQVRIIKTGTGERV